MVNIAVLHKNLPSYLANHPETQQSNINVLTACTDMKELIESHQEDKQVQALVLDLSLLGESPLEATLTLERKFKPELTLIVYTFAKWSLLESLRDKQRHLMRAPVSARALRSSMIGLIVKQLTQNPTKKTNPPAASASISGPAPMRQFSESALVELQEIISNVDCECPNQVADLVLALNAFEDYSKNCQNRNSEDAKMHALLARVTGHARAHMEYALRELCIFEKIDISSLSQAS